MKCCVRRIYLAAGLVWGVILAAVLALFVAGGSTGVLWVFVFGDQEWPAWTGTLVAALTIAVALLSLATCVFVGWWYPRRLDPETTDPGREARRAFGLLLTGLLLLVAASVMVQVRSHRLATAVDGGGSGDGIAAGVPSPTRQTEQTDVEFYCRALLGQTPIEVNYHGSSLRIVPELLVGEDGALLAVEGPYESALRLAREIVFMRDRSARPQWTSSGCTVLPRDVRCGEATHFVVWEPPLPLQSTAEGERIAAHVPSLMAGFAVRVRRRD